MSYAPNYYNYQVAVIFAIVLAAALLLAAVIGLIYFACVANIRKKKGNSAMNQERYGSGPRTSEPQLQQVIGPQGGYDPNVGVNNSVQQPYDYQRSHPSPYSAAAAAMAYGQSQPQQYQQQYGQQQQFHPDTRIRDIHPEYAYQQGPITWVSTPAGPQIVPPGPPEGYHMSSV